MSLGLNVGTQLNKMYHKVQVIPAEFLHIMSELNR